MIFKQLPPPSQLTTSRWLSKLAKLSLFSILFFFPFFVSQAQPSDLGQEFTQGDYIYKVIGQNEVEVKVRPQSRTSFGRGEPDHYGNFAHVNVLIPYSFTNQYTNTTYSVTKIADSGFVGCDHLETIVIPNSITSIGRCAFIALSNLKEVFMRGESLYSVIEPEIPREEFYSKYGGNGNITDIGDSAFFYCWNLSQVEFSADLERIGRRAFMNCGIRHADLGFNIKTIGTEAFQNAPHLATVDLSHATQLDTIGNNAFADCIALESITVPASVSYLGSSAFRTCTALRTAILHNSPSVLRNYTFAGSGLTSFIVPGSVRELNIGVFKGCKNLETVYFQGDVVLETIGQSAFQGCIALRNNQNDEVLNRHYLKLPQSLKVIGDSAFKDCTSLSWLYNPGYNNTYFTNLEKIGAYAFANTSIVALELGHNTVVCTIGKAAFYNANLGHVNLGSVEAIADSVFMNCKAHNFTVSSNKQVKSIGQFAFKYSGLATIDLSEYSQLESIGYDAFHSCPNLTTVKLPASLKTIGYGAFANDTNLVSINIPEGIKKIEGYTFYKDKKLRRITLPSSVTEINNSAFRETGLQHISIPNRVRQIKTFAFYECKDLVSVLLRTAINTIDSLAFGQCQNLAVINCLAGTPPAFDSVASSHSFRNATLENITLMVPAVSLSRYKNTGWGRMMLEPYQEEDELQFLAGEWNFIAGTGRQSGVLNFNNVSAPNDNAYTFPVYTSTSMGETTTQDYRNLDYVALDFDYTTNAWKNTGMHRTHNMTEGAGYLVWMYTSNAKGTEVTSKGAITRLTDYLKTSGNVDYTTAPNNGTNVLPSVNTGYWYSFGNPFNKYLNISNVVSSIRNGANTTPIVQGSKVYVYDNSNWVEKTYGDLLPGQGFMVATANANLPLTFKMNYPSTASLPANVMKSSSVENEGIKFSLTSNGMTSYLYAKQDAEAQDGFDINDAYILFSLNEEQIEPYFLVDNNAVKYNRYNSDNYSCAINIHANNSATAQIGVSNVPEGTTVSIVDVLSNNETVLEDNVFEFDVQVGENTGRYLIKIVKNSASSLNQATQNEANISIWNNNKEISVKGEKLQRIEIYNTLGQKVYQKEVSGEAYDFTFDNEGAYVVKATSQNGTKSQKVVIK